MVESLLRDIKMDNLKFRVWEEQRKKFHYFYGIFNARPYIDHSTFVQYESSPEYPLLIIEQYTGKKDKKGQDIYEGDIDPKHGIVVFRDACFGFSHKGSHGHDGLLILPWSENIDITGNIHENKESME
jgi:hypothetical protein